MTSCYEICDVVFHVLITLFIWPLTQSYGYNNMKKDIWIMRLDIFLGSPTNTRTSLKIPLMELDKDWTDQIISTIMHTVFHNKTQSTKKTQKILTGKLHHVLPYIVEDIFFRAYLAAESRVLDTVVQVAECDSRPSILEILLHTTNNLLPLRHLQKHKCYQHRGRKGESGSGLERGTGAVWQWHLCSLTEGETWGNM